MGKMDIRNLSKKDIKKLHRWLRCLIQILFFLFLPSAFTSAFSGVKYIFTQLGTGEKIEFTSFVIVLIALCVYTIIFGRFFCGFACAFGSLGDAVHAVCNQTYKKLKKKPKKLPAVWKNYLMSVKHVVLLLIVVLCFAGVYGQLRGTSPWDVFSIIQAGNFGLGKYIPGIIILVLIMIGMAFEERFFCKFLCPMGAVFSILPIFPFFTLKRNREQCLKGCRGCTMKCPSDIELPADGSLEVNGDCFQCQKCIDVCPKENIHCGIGHLKGNEFWFTIVRALLLMVLLLWAGL